MNVGDVVEYKMPAVVNPQNNDEVYVTIGYMEL
jgi:hypothetical protein